MSFRPVRLGSTQTATFLAGCALVCAAYGKPQATHAYADPVSPAPYDIAHRAPQVKLQTLDAPTVEAASAILIDAHTGQVLYELNADDVRPPASTTKIMTAILALENSRPNSEVIVSEAATETGGSRLHISAGEHLPLTELVEATLIKSGNDGAEALAEAVGGTEANFLQMMNAKALALGMKATLYQNPHGMPMEGGGNMTSARDLATLAAYAMKNDTFRKIVSEPTVHYDTFGIRTNVDFPSTNKLLNEFPLCTGIKTGYTDAARHCLVASAQFRDREVIGVILGAEKSTIRRDMVRLFDYGLNELSDDYWIYRKFALEPCVYPFQEGNAHPNPVDDTADNDQIDNADPTKPILMPDGSIVTPNTR